MRMIAIAESIIKGLDNLDNQTKVTDKIAHKYRDKRIEIVLNHLRHLTSKCSGPDITQGKCTGCTITDVKPDCPVHSHMLSGS